MALLASASAGDMEKEHAANESGATAFHGFPVEKLPSNKRRFHSYPWP
ncbi:MAG: hypothetical protein HYY96_16325 [Candidatus Tectomicrobia bacterium]|nr:hypothetical protein [Candidatus Tectomicrobia bacterium]